MPSGIISLSLVCPIFLHQFLSMDQPIFSNTVVSQIFNVLTSMSCLPSPFVLNYGKGLFDLMACWSI